MRIAAFSTALALLLGGAIAESNLTTPQTSHQLLQGDFKPPQVWENTNLVRTTNLEKGYVRETINVVVTNKDSKPQSTYYFPVDYGHKAQIGGFEVRDKKNAEKGKFEVTTAALTTALGDVSSPQPQYFVVQFPEAVKSKDSVTLQISYHVLSALRPLPASIKQEDKQYLTYSFSAYVPTAYPTLKQKTKLKFPSANVPEYTSTEGISSSKSDPERQGSSYTYGTYDTAKVPAGTTYPISVRYEFTKPILAASLLERDVEVSHWGGNIAFEERYWLRNDGATLADHFSRVSWATQSHYAQAGMLTTSALRELKVPLKAGSLEPYFVDDIGNISTSRFRPSKVRDASLELKLRYPLFGGWFHNFKIGWSNDLSLFLRQLKTPSNTYVLNVPLLEGPKMPEGIQYEHLAFRIILPEGSSYVNYEIIGGTNLPEFTVEQTLHKTFMDTLGRTELKLEAINTVDEMRDANVVVTYNYTTMSALRKPMSIIVGAIGLFAVLAAVRSIDTRIGKKGVTS